MSSFKITIYQGRTRKDQLSHNRSVYSTVEVGKRSCVCDQQCTVPPEIRFDEALLWSFDRLPCNAIIALIAGTFPGIARGVNVKLLEYL